MRLHADRNHADRSVRLVLAVPGLFNAPTADAWRLLCLLFIRQRALSPITARGRGWLLPFFDGFKTMKNIKVLGTGCRNCEITANVIAAAAKQAGVEIELEKITDIAEIMAYGVMSTPGVVVEGKLVHSGGVPGPDQVRGWVGD
jgi:small redox-active disulfide protein 2